MFKKSVLLFGLLFSFVSFSQETYYNDINLRLTGLTLKEELVTKITSTHTKFLFYEEVWSASKATDVNPNNSQEVLLIYGWENGSDTDTKNDKFRGIDDNGGNAGNWNREHVYAQSLGTPTLGEAGPGADAHHLRPADKDWNSTRQNRKFSDGSGNSGTQSNGGWYPGDEWKGDVARMMMYMYLRYDDRCLMSNVGIGDNSGTPDDMIDLFLQWNVEDPVSDFERQRNTYHENTGNTYAQGNRNPFIDNPILATRIWGGPLAEDTWGIYTSSDTEAPTVPQNLVVNNITTKSVDLSWQPATDNVETTSYDVYIDGNLVINTTNSFVSLSDLFPNTNYSLTVVAKDIVNNMSAQSPAIAFTTLEDTEAPSVPANIVISNETTNSFIVSWEASTDNTKILNYDVYIDGSKVTTTTELNYTATNLSIATSYNVQLLSRDIVNNESALSNIVNATTNGNNATATELFFSEYVEGSSNNKAVEIVNLTGNTIDLSIYTIKRQSNGGKNGNGWGEDNILSLSGYTLADNEVFVIINGNATDQNLIDEADYVYPNESANNWGDPINFNGNDPVGLFKNNVLIDIIGTFNGGDANFAKDKTIRRKTEIVSPNINFDISNEWDSFSKDTTDDIGKHSAIVLSTQNFNSVFELYPNPVNDKLFINNSKQVNIEKANVYNVFGKLILTTTNFTNEINVSSLASGMYFVQLESDNKVYTQKFIKL